MPITHIDLSLNIEKVSFYLKRKKKKKVVFDLNQSVSQYVCKSFKLGW